MYGELVFKEPKEERDITNTGTLKLEKRIKKKHLKENMYLFVSFKPELDLFFLSGLFNLSCFCNLCLCCEV